MLTQILEVEDTTFKVGVKAKLQPKQCGNKEIKSTSLVLKSRFLTSYFIESEHFKGSGGWMTKSNEFLLYNNV